MSNIFSKAKSVKGEGVEDDFLGGGGAVDTDIYPGVIKYAYIGKASKSDARNVTISIKLGNGKEVTRSIWMTNRNGDVTYKDKKTGKLKNLPGYNQVSSLAMLLASKEVGDLDVEEKTLNLYDFESKKEIPTAVDCFVELHEEELHVAIQRQTVDKTKLNESTGDYDPTGETRDVNEFIKFFPASGLVTISEIEQFVKSLGGDFDDVVKVGDLGKAISKMDGDGAYAAKWLEANRGEIWDRSTGKKSEGKAFKDGSSGGGEKKKKSASLFDD